MNNSGTPITGLYLAYSHVGTWSGNKLDGWLTPEQSLTYTFNGRFNINLWVDYADGSVLQHSNIDTCRYSWYSIETANYASREDYRRRYPDNSSRRRSSRDCVSITIGGTTLNVFCPQLADR